MKEETPQLLCKHFIGTKNVTLGSLDLVYTWWVTASVSDWHLTEDLCTLRPIGSAVHLCPSIKVFNLSDGFFPSDSLTVPQAFVF